MSEIIYIDDAQVVIEENQIVIHPLTIKNDVQEKIICGQKLCVVFMFSSVLFVILLLIIFLK